MNNIFLYDRDYYLSDCEGYTQFSNSKGKLMSKRLKKVFCQAAIESDMRILDIGCGRGELVLHSGLKKAYVWGIDNSLTAINIGKNTLNFWKKNYSWLVKYVNFSKALATELPFADDTYDIIFMADIVEHLSKTDLYNTLREAKRVLREKGRLIIHTSPNRYYLPVAGKLFALISRIMANNFFSRRNFTKILPWNVRRILPRGLQKDVHINEQSSFSLKRTLNKAELSIEKIWFELNPRYIDNLFSDSRAFRIINILKTFFPIKHLFYADLFCLARNR